MVDPVRRARSSAGCRWWRPSRRWSPPPAGWDRVSRTAAPPARWRRPAAARPRPAGAGAGAGGGGGCGTGSWAPSGIEQVLDALEVDVELAVPVRVGLAQQHEQEVEQVLQRGAVQQL